MAFFDELTKRMNGVAQTAQKTAEIARLQRQVTVKQTEFDGLFTEIGQLYYACFKRGVEPDETMAALCGKVTNLVAEIEGLKLKLDDLRQIRRCPGCGSVQNNTSRFCANCGAKLEELPAEPEETGEASAEPAEAPNEEPGKNVYINWPETSETAEEASDDSTDDSDDVSDQT